MHVLSLKLDYEVMRNASFHEGSHCLLVPRRSSERKKKDFTRMLIGMCGILTIPAWPLTRLDNLRLVCICAVNHVQYA